MNGALAMFLLALVAVLCLPFSARARASVTPQALISAQDAWGSSVDLTQMPKEDRYSIHGSFEAETPPGAVWRVLSDYGHLSGIISSLKSSRVLERKGDMVLLEQAVEGRFLFFHKNLTLRLQALEQEPRKIDFTQVGPGPFRYYHGSWTLSPARGGGCRVDYVLQVSRGDLAPRWLEPGLFRQNALELLASMSREIQRRSLVAKSPTP